MTSGIMFYEGARGAMDARYNQKMQTETDVVPTPIAIVGIGCKFPGGADTPDKYWELLKNKTCAIGEVPADRWNTGLMYDADPDMPQRSTSKWGGFVDGILDFDAEFFGISPREVESMDPQQRILLHLTWEAFEDSGIAPDRLAGSNTGVFVGISMDDYKIHQEAGGPDVDLSHTATGASLCVASNRISNRFGFHGPSISIDTACSSSLVAVELACRNLWSGDCDVAVAGGINAMLNPGVFISFSKARMISPTGRVLTFDERADGFVRGEGAGMIIIKRLDDALRDGNRVYAVIRSAVVNQDGWTNTLTVPNAAAQSAMLRKACSRAGLSAADISYVEAHGTGTPVGDPIEANAIGRVFGKASGTSRPTTIGSVKTNIGHLEAGAGVAALIKTALALRHGEIPANPNFERINPNIPIDDYGLVVATEHQPWEPVDGWRRAAVNSFGFGGTNACVIVEEFRELASDRQQPRSDRNGAHMVPVSAATESALKTVAGRLATHLETTGKSVAMPDVVGTLALHRAHLSHRLSVVAGSKADLIRKLRAFADEKDAEYRDASVPCLMSGRRNDDPKIALAFSGQGSQWPGMATRLLDGDPVFRRAVDDVDLEMQRLGGWSVVEELRRPKATTRIDQAVITQGCIFAVQVGLFERWKAWGIKPDLVFGHSLGEIAAAYASGALTLSDAVRVVHMRSTLQAETEGTGAIYALGLSAEEVHDIITERGDPEVEIGAVNGSQMVTVSGEKGSVHALLRHVRKHVDKDVFTRRIRMNFAPHSPQMDKIRERFLAGLQELRPQPAKIPLISTVTGEAIDGAELDAEYWWRNIRNPVLFQNAVQSATERGADLFLEVGPAAPLSGLIAACAAGLNAPVTIVRSQKKGENDLKALNSAAGALYVAGVPFDWDAVVDGNHQRVALPGYPWEYKDYWFDREGTKKQLLGPTPHPMLGQRMDTALPTWESTLSMNQSKFLRDHMINGSYLFPAAGYIEMMVAAARELFGDGPLTLDDVELVRANFLTADRSETFQVSYDPDRRRVSVSSRSSGGVSPWELRAHATLTVPGTGTAPSIPRPQRLEGKSVLNARQFYELAESFGYGYTGDFRGISRLSVGDKILEADLKAPGTIAKRKDYHFYPPYLDCLLQGSIAFLVGIDLQFAQRQRLMFLPRTLRRIRLYGQPTARTRLVVRQRKMSAQQTVYDVDLFDSNGNCIVQMEGYASAAVPRGEDIAGRSAAESAFYTEHWVRSVPSPRAEIDTPATWLVFCDSKGIGAEAVTELRREGLACVAVDSGGTCRIPGLRSRRIDPKSLQDLAGLLEDIRELGSPLRGVLDLRALDHAGSSARISVSRLDRVQSSVTYPALHLVQAIVAGAVGSPHLIFATSGCKPASGDADLTLQGLGLSPLGGLCRTVFSEYPDLRATQIDLDSDLADKRGQARRLIDEALSSDASHEAEVAYRGNDRLVPRLRPRTTADLTSKLRLAATQRSSTEFQLTMPLPGDLEQLAVVEAAPSEPQPGEVLVSVKAVGINFRDVMAATGLLPSDAEPDPAWLNLGLECSGLVTAVGKGVKRLKVGDTVVANRKGCLRSQLVVPEIEVWKIPGSIDHVPAATISTAFSTAYYSLVKVGKLRKGERVLIHLGTGGVGLAAIQIARMIGAEIFTTAGSPRKRKYLRQLGLSNVMDSRSLEFADEIMEKTNGAGVDIVLNALAGAAIDKGLSILAPCGRFIEIGKRDIYGDSPLGLRALRKNGSFLAVDMARMADDNAEMLAEVFSELGELFRNGKLQPLPAEVFPLNEASQAFERMAKAEHIGKVVITIDPSQVRVQQSTDAPITLDPQGAYLVTGGLGGFGAEVATWMAQRGAGHLYLISRSGGASADAKQAIRRIRKAGAKVTALAADITKPADVRGVFDRIGADGRPLRGVIHGAVVYDDEFIPQLNARRMKQVFAPKLFGAWNLHEATRSLDLDFFALFSTFSVVWGNTRQANYVAANTFLDTLAAWRRQQGLPAISIQWSALLGGGLVERISELKEIFEAAGTPAIPLTESLPALDVLLRKDDPVIGFAKVDWSRFSSVNQPVCNQPRLVDNVSGTSVGEGRILQEVLAAPEASRDAIISEYITGEISRVLKTERTRISLDDPLQDLGLDSLNAFQLKNRLESDLSVSLQVANFLQKPTLRSLAELIAGEIGAKGGAQAEAAVQSNNTDRPSLRQMEILRSIERLGLDSAYARNFDLATALRLNLRLDIAKLREALKIAAADSPLLRAYFPMRKSGPTIRFADNPEIVSSIDCRGMTDDQVKTLLDREIATPLDPKIGPLFKVAIYQCDDDVDVLLLRGHGLVIDGLSLLVMLEMNLTRHLGLDLGHRESIRTGRSYADFAEWQRNFLQTPKGKTQLRHWTQTLGELGPALPLPYDYGRSSDVPLQSGSLPFVLPQILTANLRDIANANRKTMFTVLMAAFALLIRRHTGRADLAITSTVSGRTRSEFDSTIGPLSNSVAIRSKQHDNLSFVEYLDQIDASLKNALVHQDYPLSEIRTALAERRNSHSSPLDQVSFSMFLPRRSGDSSAAVLFGNFPGAKYRFGNVSAETVVLPSRGCKRDISAYAQEDDDRVFMRFDYDAGLFRPETIEGMADDYAAILRAAITNPVATVETLAHIETQESAADRVGLGVVGNGKSADATEFLGTVDASVSAPLAARTPGAG